MPNKRRNKRAQPRRKAATRKPDILDVHGIAAAETAHRSARAGHKAALRAIEMGDKTALAKALQSGVVRVKAA
jgi:hypothetical protein